MKISSLKKTRIHNSFVNRNSDISKPDVVESISPTKNVQNSPFYSSENYLLLYDNFYDNFKELKEEYKRFYHDEQILEKAIDNFDQDTDKLSKNMKELIEKYNIAVKSLSSFDKAFVTNHIMKIQNLLYDFEKELKNLGIYIVNDIELMLEDEILTQKIQSNEKALEFLFEPAKGLILKIYHAFRDIKLSKKTAIEEKYDNVAYKGMLLDDKT